MKIEIDMRPWRVFVAGMVCGATLGATGVLLLWPKQANELDAFSPATPAARTLYDTCLMTNAGNKVMCAAFLRSVSRGEF
jgi:hypothetical protein